MLAEQLDKDLKAAMLARDDLKTSVLKSLKTALQYEMTSGGERKDQLDEPAIQQVLAREAKKRAEAAEIYAKAGEKTRAEAEQAEQAIIEAYLPEPASLADIEQAVDEAVAKLANAQMAQMGQIIGAVRARLGIQADGALIAKLVKQKLEGGK